MPHIEVDEGIHFSIFDPLFYVDEKGAFVAALAAEVPTVENGGISADGLSWKVKLRDDVKWHDGTPFTAEDVKFTLELLVDPNFRSWRKTGHEYVRELTVVSPTEITWKMEKPFAPYPSILASTFITPKHALGSAADRNTAPYNNAPIGTGPFKWKDRVAGDYILLEANADYFGAGPHIGKLIYKYVPDLNVMYTQFKTGDIDVVGLQWITPDHYDEAKALEGKVVTVVPGSTVESFTLNMERPQFKDPKVRQALYHAIDKQSIIDALYYGLPTPTESYVPQQSFYYNPDLPKHEYSMEKAKALLDEAGWVPGEDGIRAKDGVKLAFTCSTTAGNHIREQVQQYMQQSLKDLGIDMTISNLPPAVMWGDYWMLSKFDTVIVGLDFLTGPTRIPPTSSARPPAPPRAVRARTPGSSRTRKWMSFWPRAAASSCRKSARRPISRSRRSCAPNCPSCRSSSTRPCAVTSRVSKTSCSTSTPASTPGMSAAGPSADVSLHRASSEARSIASRRPKPGACADPAPAARGRCGRSSRHAPAARMRGLTGA